MRITLRLQSNRWEAKAKNGVQLAYYFFSSFYSKIVPRYLTKRLFEIRGTKLHHNGSVLNQQTFNIGTRQIFLNSVRHSGTRERVYFICSYQELTLQHQILCFYCYIH